MIGLSLEEKEVMENVTAVVTAAIRRRRIAVDAIDGWTEETEY